MGVYNNNKDGTRSTIANTIQVVDAPTEQFVSRDEFSAVVPNDTSADNKLVNDDKLDTKLNDIWKVQGELGAKNLLVYPYNESSKTTNGITYTINDDGSIIVNGTATSSAHFFLEDDFTLKKGSYILNTTELLPESVYSQVLNKDTGVTIATIGNNNIQSSLFTLVEDTVVRIRISVSVRTIVDNLVIYEMLRYASDTDDTWQPYIPTNKGLKDLINATYIYFDSVGAKNLLPYPYLYTTTSNNGITFTDNGDGSISFVGTATSGARFNLNRGLKLKENTYILSNGLAENENSNVTFVVRVIDSSGTTLKNIVYLNQSNKKNFISFTISASDAQLIDENYLDIYMSIAAGTVADNTVYPMIRFAADIDDTWQPYAPTNYQLNQKLDTIAGVYLPNATTPTSKKVVASVGQTSVTFDASTFMSRYNVTSDDLDLDISAKTSNGDIVSYNNVNITGGIVTVTFDALAEQTTFICKCSIIQ